MLGMSRALVKCGCACAGVCVPVSVRPLQGLSRRSCVCTRVSWRVNIYANTCITARGRNGLGMNKTHGNVWSLVPGADVVQRESRWVPGG